MVLLGALICLTCFDGLLVLGGFVGCYLFCCGVDLCWFWFAWVLQLCCRFSLGLGSCLLCLLYCIVICLVLLFRYLLVVRLFVGLT